MARPTHAPLIGITCEAEATHKDFSEYDLVCDHRYASAVKDAGGHPVLLPIAHRNSVMHRYLEGIAGLVIVGGDDVDPRLYGEEPRKRTRIVLPARTAFETWLYRTGKRRGLPILGICYGMQLINVLEGGTLIQHLIPRRRGPRIHHGGKKADVHRVKLLAGTRLKRIVNVWQADVSSGHHQAIRRVAPGFVVAAVAEDGVVEAIENPDHPEILAVQWHPETLLKSQATRKLFRAFVRMCAAYQKAQA